ncbi:hypothetical protein [Thermoflexus hugenholtzii]
MIRTALEIAGVLAAAILLTTLLFALVYYIAPSDSPVALVVIPSILLAGFEALRIAGSALQRWWRIAWVILLIGIALLALGAVYVLELFPGR